jgi:hypothetical protein
MFLSVSLSRLYLPIEADPTDHCFSPHLLVTLFSVVIAAGVHKAGFRGGRITRRSALFLIRSGSILLVIWGYRFYLTLRTVRSPFDLKAHLGLATFYLISGTAVMLMGLRLSRELRGISLPAPTP